MKPEADDMLRAAVAEALARTGLSQRELARRAGIPAPNLSNWLKGKSAVTTRTASRLMSALGLEVRPR